MPGTWSGRLGELLELPQAQQVDAARALLEQAPAPMPEAWNSRFGPGSLFDAWTRTTIARQAHRALAAVVLPTVRQPTFSVVEVGAGNGRLWASVLDDDDRGRLTVVDPVPEAIEQVRAVVPAGVEVVGIEGCVEDVDLPQADLIVCSMTLHHLAGRDAAERARHGLTGPGKAEVLTSMRRSLLPGGRLVLLEADIHCEVDVPSGDPSLRDAIFDSYVRRCGRSIVEADLGAGGGDADLRARWEALLRHWFLGQLAVADLPVAERDVYELEVSGWLQLLATAGFEVTSHRFTDRWKLFHLYEAQRATTS